MCDLRPPTFLPVSMRLRCRPLQSLATRRPFSYSANAPATCRIILRSKSPDGVNLEIREGERSGAPRRLRSNR
jgi:hypothetical protein